MIIVCNHSHSSLDTWFDEKLASLRMKLSRCNPLQKDLMLRQEKITKLPLEYLQQAAP